MRGRTTGPEDLKILVDCGLLTRHLFLRRAPWEILFQCSRQAVNAQSADWTVVSISGEIPPAHQTRLSGMRQSGDEQPSVS